MCLWSFSSKYPTDHLLYHVVNAHFWVEGKTCCFCACIFKCKWAAAPLPTFQKRAEPLQLSSTLPKTKTSVWFLLSSLLRPCSCDIAVLHHESLLSTTGCWILDSNWLTNILRHAVIFKETHSLYSSRHYSSITLPNDFSNFKRSLQPTTTKGPKKKEKTQRHWPSK